MRVMRSANRNHLTEPELLWRVNHKPYLIATALAGEPAPPIRFSGFDTSKNSYTRSA